MTSVLVLALLVMDAEALLEAASRYMQQHRREFRQFVSNEREVQKFYDKSGGLRQTREIIAEAYILSLPDRPGRTYEFREILQVNGRKRLRDESLLPSLLAMKGNEFEDEYLRLREESSRYNLFSGRGFLSNVALALLEAAGFPGRRDAQYRVSGRAGEDYVLEFIQAHRAALSNSYGQQPLTVRGQMHLSPDGSIRSRESSLAVQTDGGLTTVRYAIEYREGPDGVQAPVRRVIAVNLTGQDDPVAESVSTFSEYRRMDNISEHAER